MLFIFSAIFAKEKTLYLFDSDGIPWFVLSLFWMNLITMYTKKFKPQWVLALSLILSVFAGYNHRVMDEFAILRTINFYPFFYLGYIAVREKLTAFLNKKYIKIISAVFVAALAVLCFAIPQKISYFRLFVTGRVVYSYIGNAAVWGGFIRLGVFYGTDKPCTVKREQNFISRLANTRRLCDALLFYICRVCNSWSFGCCDKSSGSCKSADHFADRRIDCFDLLQQIF